MNTTTYEVHFASTINGEQMVLRFPVNMDAKGWRGARKSALDCASRIRKQGLGEGVTTYHRAAGASQAWAID